MSPIRILELTIEGNEHRVRQEFAIDQNAENTRRDMNENVLENYRVNAISTSEIDQNAENTPEDMNANVLENSSYSNDVDTNAFTFTGTRHPPIIADLNNIEFVTTNENIYYNKFQ